MREFTEAQKKQLVDLIAKWQERLRLQHWTIRAKWDEPPPDECLLYVVAFTDRNMATIYVGDLFEPEVTDAERENAVAHELIHCHVQPVWDVLDGVLQELGSQARTHMTEVLRQRTEVMVDALATSFAPID